MSVNAFSYNNNDDNQFHVFASLLRKASSVLHLGAKFFPVQSQTNTFYMDSNSPLWIDKSIHPSSKPAASCTQGCRGPLESIPAAIVMIII